MTKRAGANGLPAGRCLVYPMARLQGEPDVDRDAAAFIRRLPAWATNPVIRESRQTSNDGWWMATVEVDAPPPRVKENDE